MAQRSRGKGPKRTVAARFDEDVFQAIREHAYIHEVTPNKAVADIVVEYFEKAKGGAGGEPELD